MVSIFTELEYFNYLKLQYLGYQTAGFPGGDEEMFPILELLNKHPSIAPRWHCASHPEEERSQLYVTFAVRDQNGLDYLFAVYTALRSFEVGRFKDDQVADYDFWTLGVSSLLKIKSTELWTHWTLETFTTEQNKDEYLSDLMQAMKSISWIPEWFK